MITRVIFGLLSSVEELRNSAFPVFVPEGTKQPYATFGTVSHSRINSHGGDSNLVLDRFQIRVWAESYELMREIRAKIVRTFSLYEGVEQGGSVISPSQRAEGFRTLKQINDDFAISKGIRVVRLFTINDFDMVDRDLEIFNGTTDVLIRYKETALENLDDC